MIMKCKHISTILLLLAAFSSLEGMAFGYSIPDWFRAAAKETLPSYPSDTRAVVLLDEEVTTVQDNGDIKTNYRRVVKILTTEGRGFHTAKVHFDSQTKLTYFKAWSISSKGEEYEVKEKDAIEASPYSGELYSDQKIKIIEIPASEPGSVVGFEYEQKRRPFLFDDGWGIQESVPVHRARYILILPPGWEYKNYWRNHEDVKPQQNGNSFTWELVDVPGVKYERSMPPARAILARMYVKFIPSNPALKDKFISDWKEYGRWSWSLTDSQRIGTPEIKQRVDQLTAGKTKTLDKIRALGAFAQREVRYVAIEIGIGGFQPHAAPDIFRSRYGDCKDKATILSTMLREIGVESYLVDTYNTRGSVDPNIPSSFSFNHVILAIKLPDGTPIDNLFSTVDSKSAGRILLFDPTDQYTPLGNLPTYEQGSYGVLTTAQGGELVQFPLQPPYASQLNRIAKLTLSPTGVLTGEVKETRIGGEAVRFRETQLSMQVPQRTKFMENYLSIFLTNYSLKEFQILGLEDYDKEIVLNYKFEANNYATNAGSMVLVRPRVFGSKSEGIIDMKERKYGFEVDQPTLQSDDFEITLPEGYTIDELPAKLNLINPAASYLSESKLEDGPNGRKILHYKRTFKVEQVSVPFEKLAELNTVYRKIIADEKNSAILKHQ